jgi:hypothetical protein
MEQGEAIAYDHLRGKKTRRRNGEEVGMKKGETAAERW